MTTTTTTIPADDGFGVAVPCFDHTGLCGFTVDKVTAWRIAGPVDSGQLIPVSEDDDDLGPDDLFAVEHPDGSFRFSDGERCDTPADLLASFRRRHAAEGRR